MSFSTDKLLIQPHKSEDNISTNPFISLDKKLSILSNSNSSFTRMNSDNTKSVFSPTNRIIPSPYNICANINQNYYYPMKQNSLIEKNIKNDFDKYLNINTEKLNMNINMNINNNIYNFSLADNKVKEKLKIKKKFFCNCKKSGCLKLYCDCFANGEVCVGCNCKNCSNTLGNEELVRKTYDEVVEKNPVALKLNIQNDVKINGCNCTKSNCLKKYCECYKAGLLCSKSCRCKICDNMGKSFYEEEEKNQNSEIKKTEIIETFDEEKTKNENSDKKDKKLNQKRKRYDYDDFNFEKVSIKLEKTGSNVEIYKYLKNIDVEEDLKNNNVIFKMYNDIGSVIIPKKLLGNLDKSKKDDCKINNFLNRKTLKFPKFLEK